jgi:transcriptional regulator with XRE-family HTH domain
VKSGRDSFGGRLRAQRERAGVTLEAIAESTKVRRSLLVDLENNNLSRWPDGLFRRAFFRDYLAAIGIESEAVVAEFVRLFPESGEPVVEAPGALEGGDGLGGELRLQLAPAPFTTARRILLQAAASVIDLGLVSLITFGAVELLAAPVWTAISVVALTYYAVSGAWLGRTPALWLLLTEFPGSWRTALRSRRADRRLLRLVARQRELAKASGAEEELPSQPHAV